MSNSEPVIKVTGLGKQYMLGKAKSDRKTLGATLGGMVTGPLRAVRGKLRGGDADGESQTKSFWALKDVNFEINPGEVVGIIGRNGAGKSTLLKILSRITDPTEGEINITGRVGSLLEVGTGFHPELTGRENVYLNGAILGMKKADIAKKFDEIVAFAEVEEFLDTAVKKYSSGMYTRLAFAVAAHLDPEILIVDEVLAVGDAEFQKKCLGKMKDVSSHGRTVLFVSHNMAAIENLCTHGVLLAGGRVVTVGRTSDVLDQYRAMARGKEEAELSTRADRGGTGRVRATHIELLDRLGCPATTTVPGAPFRFRISGTATGPIPRLEASIDLDTADGSRVTTFFSGFKKVGFPIATPGRFTLDCEVSDISLRPDSYFLNIWLGTSNEVFDFVSRAGSFEVEATDFYGGGRIPDRAHGPVMSNFNWTIAPTAGASQGES